MLRQVFILKQNEIIYKRIFGNALKDSEMEDLSFKIKTMTYKKSGKEVAYFDYFNYKVSYIIETGIDLTFVFITGLMDDFFRGIKPQLTKFKEEFLNQFPVIVFDKKFDPAQFRPIDEKIDMIHTKLRPKIAVVGFSGVGKTTIKRLIKLNEVPLQHIPTITGDIATIKIGKLYFKLFDFAGQDQFKYLWKGFIKGSDAVLIVTDSTPKNIEKSKFFIELTEKEAPEARSAVIGNKQDLRKAMNVEEIESILCLKTYPMVANNLKNRDKMIRVIAEVLDMNIESNPLLAPLFEEEEFTIDTECVIGTNGVLEAESVENTENYDDVFNTYKPSLTTLTSESKKSFKNYDGSNGGLKVRNPLDIIEEIGDNKSKSRSNDYDLDLYINKMKSKVRGDFKDVNLQKRLLGIIKAKKRVKMDYIERFLKISQEKIIGMIFDLIGSGNIEGEFNEDDTEFTLSV